MHFWSWIITLICLMASGEGLLHANITTTMFWAGETADESNLFISNEPSAWDEEWTKHYGGVDDPNNRNGFHPAFFTPNENPFYFALPYNDFDEQGERKENVYELIPWAKSKEWKPHESMCKNQWIEIRNERNESCFAQWQDVGPNGEEDEEYVFGTALPSSTFNDRAGLDVSPAVRDFLTLSGMDKTSWRFVPFEEVPEGPWREIITTRNGEQGESSAASSLKPFFCCS